MDTQRILEELLSLLADNGVEIRHESVGGSGGLCSVKGKQIFFLDTQSSVMENAVLCAKAAIKLLDLDTVYLRPEVRQFVEYHTKAEREKKNRSEL